MSVPRNMELRHLSISHILQLSQILDNNDAWKSLMEKIPKNLDDIQNDVNDSSKITRKYSADNIRQIVDSSKEFRRSPTQILLDEWGTSGKKRATVSDLLELLIKVQLYRAADFVAKDILHEALPKRPQNGPVARVDITLPVETFDKDVIENLLNNVSYPYTSQLAAQLLEKSMNSLINNNNRDISNAISVECHKSIFNSPDEVASDRYELKSDTDLIKFSVDGAAATCETINTTSNNENTSVSMHVPKSTVSIEKEAEHASSSSANLSSSILQMTSCNLPIMYSNSENLPNHVLNATNENETAISSSSSMSSSSLSMAAAAAAAALSSNIYSNICSSGNLTNQSTLIPDIDNLQIRDQISEHLSVVSTPLTHSTLTTNNDDAKTLSEYIPNLSLLNGS